MALRYKTANRGHQRLLACTGQSVIAIDLGSDDLALTCGRKRCQDPGSDVPRSRPLADHQTFVHPTTDALTAPRTVVRRGVRMYRHGLA
jgi:hypothetical protein